MPTYDPLQSYTWATSTSPNSDYGSRAYIEHARRELERQRQRALQQQQDEERRRAEIDARVRDFQASLAENPIEWAQQQYENIPGPTIEEVRARAREQQTARPFVPMDFNEVRVPISNNLDPVINNPEKPGRSPF
jgi:hypothetical protein